MLTIRDSFYPGWRADIDGAPVPIGRAEEIFQSVPVPAGRHIVNLSYRPQLIYLGIAISLLTGLSCAILIGTKRFS
jgi:uncharacterized membrane protein YfhO